MADFSADDIRAADAQVMAEVFPPERWHGRYGLTHEALEQGLEAQLRTHVVTLAQMGGPETAVFHALVTGVLIGVELERRRRSPG